MKLSTKTRYSTRIMLELARHRHQGPLQVSEISRRQNIPAKYLEQLIRTLKQAGLVNSVRGAKGGHVMAQSPREITLGRLVRLFETQADLVACVSAPEKCAMSDECRTRMVWLKATRALYRELDAVTVADLLDPGKCPQEAPADCGC